MPDPAGDDPGAGKRTGAEGDGELAAGSDERTAGKVGVLSEMQKGIRGPGEIPGIQIQIKDEVLHTPKLRNRRKETMDGRRNADSDGTQDDRYGDCKETAEKRRSGAGAEA